MSQIYDILKEGQYQPSSQIDRRMQYHVDIKSDAFYCDERQKRSDEVRYAQQCPNKEIYVFSRFPWYRFVLS